MQNVFSAYQRFAQGAGPFILERLHETSTLKHLFRDYENSVAAIENEIRSDKYHLQSAPTFLATVLHWYCVLIFKRWVFVVVVLI